MADNTTINLGAGGDTIATRAINGVKHQQTLTEFGDGVGGATEVSTTDPLPIVQAAAQLLNMEVTEGGQIKAWVVDNTTQGLLHQILMELKALNLYHASMTDMHIETE